jgi:hypothetical protein
MNRNWKRMCDFLNVPNSLSYKNEYLYATNVGAVLTILFFIIIILLTSYEIVVLTKKSSFKLITNQYTDFSQVLDFSKSHFLFQLINDKGKSMKLDDKLFNLKPYMMELTVKYENGIRIRKLTNTLLEIDSCDKIYSNFSYYSELNLSEFLCFKPGQNLTAFGLLGDRFNPYKGIRIYINRCDGDDCYDDEEFEIQFHNVKFMVTYLSLGSNLFDLKDENVEYQIFTQSMSISTNMLKKIVLTFNAGIFELYNNIIFGEKMVFNYVFGNDYSVEADLDFTITLQKKDILYHIFHFFIVEL